MLISVHIPKTAGTSFRQSLEAHYGDALVLDYQDRPINESEPGRNARAVKKAVKNVFMANHARCIHGHFMPFKYRWAGIRTDRKFVMWLRDPVERLASHYYYWKRDYNPEAAGSLRRRVIEENWDLERFCLCEELRNINSRLLWGFPLRRFHFIGITEYFETELLYFSREFLGKELEMKEANANPEKPSRLYVEDPAFRKTIETYHARDMALYETAVREAGDRIPN